MNKFFENAAKFLVKNSPYIFAGIGLTGVAVSTIMACKATPGAIQDIKECEEQKHAPLTTVEKVKVGAKHYAPAVSGMILASACIINAMRIQSKRLATSTALCTAAEASIAAWKRKTEEMIGDKKMRELQTNVSQERIDTAHVDQRDNFDQLMSRPNQPEGKVLFWDEMFGTYFWSTVRDVKMAEVAINKSITRGPWATVAELYDLLDIPDRFTILHEMSWSDEVVGLNNMLELNIDDTCWAPDGSGRQVAVMKYSVRPSEKYQTLH